MDTEERRRYVHPACDVPWPTNEPVVNRHALLREPITCSYDTFHRLTKALREPHTHHEWTRHECRTWLLHNICTDWFEMSSDGDRFSGFYAEPDDTYARNHAWDLTFDRNVKHFWRLSFPPRMLRAVALWACSHRCESIREINSICVWLVRQHQRWRALPVAWIRRSGIERHLRRRLGTDVAGVIRSFLYNDGASDDCDSLRPTIEGGVP